MDNPTDIFSSKQAAAYLVMHLSTLKHHVKAGNIHPVLLGTGYVFTRQQLDDFRASKRPQGRPLKTRS